MDPLAAQRAFLNDETAGMTAGGSPKADKQLQDVHKNIFGRPVVDGNGLLFFVVGVLFLHRSLAAHRVTSIDDK